VGNGASTVACNAIDGKKGKDVLDGLGTAMIAGGVAGYLAGASGKVVGEALKEATPIT
jgi:hypothetical protein